MYKWLKISLLFFKGYQVEFARHLEVLTEHYLQEWNNYFILNAFMK